ncbi:MAG: D-aminoacylase [Candidatus Bathyarchaeota archaeon]|jgi:N-acyl-D-amino-acid deacylase|nr:D-aminoacylase [Candidatus Bathyarchaeota archaeon]
MDLDFLFVNAKVIDGAGNPWFRADVGIKGDKIKAVGSLSGANSERTIYAGGLVVAPGFIDIHSHSDYNVLIDPRVESKVRQGVTTEVVGNCGSSAAPMNACVKAYRERYMRARLGDDFHFSWESMGDYLGIIDASGASFNVVSLVGQGTIRQNVMRYEDREPTKSELDDMKALVAGAMEDGAWGMSTGLIYTPSAYAGTPEIIELTKVIRGYSGVYFSHIRGEGETLLDAVNEAIHIGKEANVPVQIAHFKASGKPHWGKIVDSLRLVAEGRDAGIDVTFDQYPYIASSTGLAAYMPHWAQEGGAHRLLERLKNPEIREKIREDQAVIYRNWDIIMVASAKNHPEYEGKRISEIAEIEGKEHYEAVFDLLLNEDAQVSVVSFGMSEDDVRRVMRSPHGMVGSDGSAVASWGILGKGKPHPRFYGTFPRVIGHYVREGVLTLQEAIRKMTSAPALRLGLRDRGLLREDFKADLTVFDPENVNDEATFVNPHRFASGIPYVMVNGELVVDGGKHTGALPGRVLRKSH